MKTEVDRRFLVKSYQGAGADFLAYRLAKLFKQIKTPEDIALHNEILDEVMLMIEPNNAVFMRELARVILYAPKNFLKSVANRIMIIAGAKTNE